MPRTKRQSSFLRDRTPAAEIFSLMKKPRIPVSAPAPAFASPFSALEIAGLPEGPKDVPPPKTEHKKGRVVLRREKSGRGGKTVIVVSDFADHFTLDDIAEFARAARQSCGCGGTCNRREIELQGDQPDRVRAFFEKEGFRVAGV